MRNKLTETAIAISVGIALLACAVCTLMPYEEPTFSPDAIAATDIAFDPSDAAKMHSLGLPTKEDVMQWHLHGQWGYIEYGEQVSYADLPGGAAFWDELYGIEPNPNFDK